MSRYNINTINLTNDTKTIWQRIVASGATLVFESATPDHINVLFALNSDNAGNMCPMSPLIVAVGYLWTIRPI